MLLTLLAGSIFFINTVTIGYYLQVFINKFFQQAESPKSVLSLLLLGIIGTYVYLNICSFFTAVNYKLIIPLFVIACITGYLKRTSVHQLLKKNYQYIRQNIWLCVGFTVLLLLFLASPPINVDSRDYHFTSIYFYEHYKVIPGLANVHGRLAFNPASFIISAAYAFTNVFGQSVYPINLVLLVVFLGWIMKRILLVQNYAYIILYISLVYLLRQFFPNIASPSSDTLAVIIAFYIGYSLFVQNWLQITPTNLPITIILCCLFAVTVKLSLLPIICIALYILCKHKCWKYKKTIVFVLISGLLIYLPWIGRNIIMSGYLAYPLLQIDLFSVDWKAPTSIAALDLHYINYSPKWVEFGVYNFPINFYNWIPTWIIAHVKMNRLLELPFLVIAFSSPFLWLLLKWKKIPFSMDVFVVWLIYYVGCILWLFSSPEYRFGYAYLIIAAIYPIIILCNYYKGYQVNKLFVIAMHICVLAYSYNAYYRHTKHPRFYNSSIKNYWLYPLKDKELLKGTDNIYKIENYSTFSIYYADMTDCIHVNEPCVGWKYGTVVPRGTTIEDGFKLVKDEVYKNYPFINNH